VGGREGGSEGYQGLTRVNYLQYSQDSLPTTVLFIFMSKSQ